MKRMMIVLLLLVCVLLIQGQVMAMSSISQDSPASWMSDGCESGDDGGGDPAPGDGGGGGNE